MTFKNASLIIICFLIFSAAFAQKDKSKRKSPPAQITEMINEKKVTIDYSKPSKRGREIFGSLVGYGTVWRTGANETTWVELSDDMKVEGKKIKAGKYGLFTIPGEDQWVIIFNDKWDGWGAYKYEESEDVLRVNVPVKQMEDVSESFTIDMNSDGLVSLMWDTALVEFNLE